MSNDSEGQRLKVLVYIDRPSQQKYVGELRLAAAQLEDAEVVAAGPGATSGHFDLEGVTAAPTAGTRPSVRLRLASVLRSMLKSVREAGSFGAAVANCAHAILAAAKVPYRTVGAMRLVLNVDPDVVVVLEDNCEGLTGFVTDAARRARRPLLVIPCYIPNPDEPAKYYINFGSHRLSGLVGMWMASLRTYWRYRYRGTDLLRLPLATIVLYRLVGRRAVRPWILNSGFAEAIAVESEASRQRYMQLGFRASKLRVIGDGLSDELFKHSLAAKRDETTFRRRYFEDATKPLIVCALPPNQYEITRSPAFEYRSYESLVAGWVDTFRAVSDLANVLVCVHPRMQAEGLQGLESPSVRLADGHLHEVLPYADLFAASVSTTIGWALSLGIPVINYDCYRFGYADFRAASGVVHVADRAAFEAALRKVLVGELPVLTQMAAAEAREWGLVDGGYQRRLAALVAEVAQQRGLATPTHDV